MPLCAHLGQIRNVTPPAPHRVARSVLSREANGFIFGSAWIVRSGLKRGLSEGSLCAVVAASATPKFPVSMCETYEGWTKTFIGYAQSEWE
jgi:hypothetical protein